METPKRSFILRADEIVQQEATFSHPWNPNSCVTGTHLSQLLGLKRVGVSLVRVPSGKESFVYHAHCREEEWIYILSGQGIAEINDDEFEVQAGDFMGFPTPGVAHHLRNPYPENLVYLMGGENLDIEIADFPRLGKRMLRYGEKIEIYDQSDARSFGPLGDI